MDEAVDLRIQGKRQRVKTTIATFVLSCTEAGMLAITLS